MPAFRLPLSGDVVQAINPWQWTMNAAQGQWGLVNINLGRSSDPQVEARILDDVGSYGRQIGRIGDVLELLVDQLDPAALSPAQREVVEAFRDQLRDVRRIKAKR